MTLGDLGDTLGAGRVTLGSFGSPWHHFGSLEGHFSEHSRAFLKKKKRASRSIAKTGLFRGSKSVAGAVFSSLSRKDRILDVLKT